MRQCTRSLDFLLEADVDELRGIADTEAGAHVRSCDRCAAAAHRVIASNELLGAALGSFTKEFDVDAVLARGEFSPESAPGPERARPLAWRRWTAVAVAASIGALMLVGDRAPPAVSLSPRATGPVPTVEAPADQNVAVLETDNPNITVLWFF